MQSIPMRYEYEDRQNNKYSGKYKRIRKYYPKN